MLIRQYAYFALRSERTAATDIAARVGLEPDQVMVRGSKRADPVLPVSHAWQIVCRLPGLPVDDLITHLLDRLEPFADEIGRLVTEGDVHACMQVVRHFDEGEDEDLSTGVDGLVKLAGQHQLLGWHLNRRTLNFLTATNADLDVDEYG
ncbi:DUF4279 domain-containing protein [Micromonosporaceae bacterium Da 78-11]